jgi:acyl-CoA synthetase (AMP-forming)/AMP-acid ligase II
MKGYFGNEKATQAVSKFGWHHTGDLGYQDDEGYFYLVDRKRDIIISGGFNIYPGEIEQVLFSHPAVSDCAVIGVPDRKWGESVKAIVQCKPGLSATQEQLIQLCEQRLGKLKTPKSIEFWDDLPRSPVGKVLKKEIRFQFWKDQERNI